MESVGTGFQPVKEFRYQFSFLKCNANACITFIVGAGFKPAPTRM